MASQSDSPPSSGDDMTRKPASQATLPTTENLKEAKADPPTEESPPSVFVNSEPIREDQVQNAVKFLSHPKVRGSPVIYRRSFLEKKGLTREEIDEAFRRVPDPTPSATPSQPAATNQDGQMKSLSATQPVPSASSGTISKVRKLSSFHWSNVLVAVSVLGASGAGTFVVFKKSIVPRFKSWIRKVVFEGEDGDDLMKINKSLTSLAEEATVASKTAAAAAADLAQTSKEVFISQREERKCFQDLIELVGSQTQEMRSVKRALLKLEGQTSADGRMMGMEQDGPRVTNSKQSYAYGKVDNDVLSGLPGISSAPATSVQPSAAPHPNSYMDIMAMIQRGERPSNIREINDQPPNPNQPLPNPRFPPRPKPWEVGQWESSYSIGGQYQENSNGFDSRSQGNQTMGEGSTPWWQQKNSRITETETGGSSVPVERPVQQRSWVPPQPPPIAMAEAAAAIRQQKKSTIQREQTTSDDDKLQAARSLGITDELQKITKFSESGGSGIEANPIPVGGENSAAAAHNTTEIQNKESFLQGIEATRVNGDYPSAHNTNGIEIEETSNQEPVS